MDLYSTSSSLGLTQMVAEWTMILKVAGSNPSRNFFLFTYSFKHNLKYVAPFVIWISEIKKGNGPISKATLKLKFTGSKSITIPEKDM